MQMNGVALFSNQNKSSKTTKDLQLKTAKSSCGMFARLYVGCQARGGDLNEFFKHENQSFLPSLERSHDHVVSEPKVSAVVIDGAALVHMLKPGQT